MKSWKTTVSAVLTAFFLFVLFDPQWFPAWLVSLSKFGAAGGLVSFGISAKDFNVTGTSRAILALILIPCLFFMGCARSVTIPAPTAQPLCPDPTEQVKAIAASNIDPAIKPTVINSVEQTAKDNCATLQRTHSDEYAALLVRAEAAAKNINGWVNTLLGAIVGGGILGVNVATLVK